MSSPALFPTNDQRRPLGPGYRIGLAFVIFVVLLGGLLGLTIFLVPGKHSNSVFENLLLVSAIGAIVISLLPEIFAWKIQFFARLCRVFGGVLFAECIALFACIVWSLGDGPKSFALWTGGLWLVHAGACLQVLSSVGYLLTGVVPAGDGSGDSDDSDWRNREIGPSCNIDGTPMVGSIDANGNAFGVTSTSYDSSSSMFDDSTSSMSTSTDYGVNPTTGLMMVDSAIDVGGHTFCEMPSSFDSSCGSSYDYSSTSSMFGD